MAKFAESVVPAGQMLVDPRELGKLLPGRPDSPGALLDSRGVRYTVRDSDARNPFKKME